MRNLVVNPIAVKSVENFCEIVKKATLGIDVVSVTIPKMLKTNNPFYGRVKKVSLMTDIGFGMDYKSLRDKENKEQGKEPNFNPEKPRGMHWVNHPYILQSDKDENTFYVRAYWRGKTNRKVFYLLDGKRCSAADLREIMQFFPKPYKNEKTEVKPFNITIDNIMVISQGKKVFNRLERMFSLQEIYSFFE